MSGIAVVGDRYDRQAARRASGWVRDYLRKAALADFGCAIIGVFVAAQIRFGNGVTETYVALSMALPVLWISALWLSGGFDIRFIGTGSDEFRKVLNAGIGLTAALAVFSYAINLELSRAYVLIALPTTTLLDLCARYAVRKRLHWQRASGRCMLSVVAVGHESSVTNLVTELQRDRYHGMTVVGACVAQPSACSEVAGVPVYGGLDDVTAAVDAFGATQSRCWPARRWMASRCAASLGNWRRAAPTYASRRPCSMWPGRAPRSGRRAGSRCCMSTTRD